jgi:hypothetical protein
MGLTGYLAFLLPIIQPYMAIIAIGLIIIGLVNCIWGYRLLKIAQGSQGFFAGVVVGGSIGFYSGADDPVQAMVLVIICGVTGLAMSLAYDRLAYFLMGSLTGALLILVTMVLTGGITNLFLVIVGALIGGCLMAVMEDAASMVSTPLLGAWGLTAGLAVLFGLQGRDLAGINATYENLLGGSNLFNLAWLVFAAAGLAIQQGMLRKNLSNQRRSLIKPLPYEPEGASNVVVKLSGGITDKNGNPVSPDDINWLSVDEDGDSHSDTQRK